MACIELLQHPGAFLQDTLNRFRANTDLHNKIKVVTLVILTNIIVRVNPVVCTISLVASFFGGREVYALLRDRFLADFHTNRCMMAIAIGIVGFAAPHFAILAASAIYCVWAGSCFKMFLRNEI